MKRVFALLIFATLIFTSCDDKHKTIKEVEFFSDSYEIDDNIIEIERGSILEFSVKTHTNIFPGPTFFWNKYGEKLEKLDENHYHWVLESQINDEYFCTNQFNIPLSDSLYQINDHYVLSVAFGTDGNLHGGELHILIK